MCVCARLCKTNAHNDIMYTYIYIVTYGIIPYCIYIYKLYVYTWIPYVSVCVCIVRRCEKYAVKVYSNRS